LKSFSSRAVSSSSSIAYLQRAFILEEQPGLHEALIIQASMALYALIQIILRRRRMLLKLKLNKMSL